jgi:hypothetical protein
MAPNKVIIIDDSLPNSAPASIAQKGRKCDCETGAESAVGSCSEMGRMEQTFFSN